MISAAKHFASPGDSDHKSSFRAKTSLFAEAKDCMPAVTVPEECCLRPRTALKYREVGLISVRSAPGNVTTGSAATVDAPTQ